MPECPKCSFEVSPEAVDCPSCGVVIAKFRPTPAAADLPESPFPGFVSRPDHAPVEGYPAKLRISDATLDSLGRARPWLRFLATYGFVVLALMLVVGAGMFLVGLRNPKLLPLSAVYVAYGLIGFAIVLPLHRSAVALSDLPRLGASVALENFATHQTAFWRRTGILTAVALAIVALALVLAAVFGALAALLR